MTQTREAKIAAAIAGLTKTTGLTNDFKTGEMVRTTTLVGGLDDIVNAIAAAIDKEN